MLQIKREIERDEIAKTITCEVFDFAKDEEIEEVTMSIEKYELIKILNRLQKTAPMYDDTMNIIWGQIEQYGISRQIEGINKGSEITLNLLNK